jgi:NAD(P)-dependent dehydrogenase (short-subunit alcohol dehydrogenase family)
MGTTEKEDQLMKLSGQVAIVTGGSSDQGRVTALLVAGEGAKVSIDGAVSQSVRMLCGLVNLL